MKFFFYFALPLLLNLVASVSALSVEYPLCFNETVDTHLKFSSRHRVLRQNNETKEIIIETSNRPGHRRVSFILAILLRDIYKFRNVSVVYQSEWHQHAPKNIDFGSTAAAKEVANDKTVRPLSRLSQCGSECISSLEKVRGARSENACPKNTSSNAEKSPCPMINLALPMAPGFNVEKWTLSSLIADGGPLGSNSRKGFFIDSSWVKKKWNAVKPVVITSALRLSEEPDERRLNFLTYGDFNARIVPKRVGKFAKDEYVYDFIDKKQILSIADAKSNITKFADNMCTMSACLNCLVAIAQNKKLGNEAIRKARDIGAGILCVVVEKDPKVAKDLLQVLSMQPDNGDSNPAPLLFDLSPSELTVSQDLTRVNLDPCDEDFGVGRPVRCEYPTNQLTKVVSLPISRILKNDAWKLIKKMLLRQKDFRDLLKIVVDEAGSIDTDYDAACRWMRNDLKTNKTWLKWIDVAELTKPKTILIGAMFPTAHDHMSDDTLQHAINFAVEQVNQKQLRTMKKYAIKVWSMHVPCKSDEAMRDYIKMIHECESNTTYEDDCPVVAIIGCICSKALIPVLDVSQHSRTLIISPTAESSVFSDSDKYPYFFRSVPPMNFYSQAIDKYLVEIRKWYRAYILSSSTMFIDKKKMPLLIEKSLEDDKWKNNVRQDISEISDVMIARSKLEEVQAGSFRIIVSDYFLLETCRLMCAATKLKMGSAQGYIWLLSPWLEDNWSTNQNGSNVCFDLLDLENPVDICGSAQDFEDTAKGYLVIRTTNTLNYDEEGLFIGTVKSSRASKLPQASIMDFEKYFKYQQGHSPMNREPMMFQDKQYFIRYGFDSVFVISHALSAFTTEELNDLHSPANKVKLRTTIENTSFTGESGQIKFNDQHFRFKGAFQVLQYHEGAKRLQMGKKKEEQRKKKETQQKEYEARLKSQLLSGNDTIMNATLTAALLAKEIEMKKAMADKLRVYYRSQYSLNTLLVLKWETFKNGSLREMVRYVSSDKPKEESSKIVFHDFICWAEEGNLGCKDGTKGPFDDCLWFTKIGTALRFKSCIGIHYVVFPISSIIAVSIIALILYCVHRYRLRKVELKHSLDEPFRMVQTELADKEMNRDNITMNRKLGEGNFGTVYGGEVKLSDNTWHNCAIKTLTGFCGPEEKLHFLREAAIMRDFSHDNVVHLLGVCTEAEPFYVILEYCFYGDLRAFLQCRRHTALNSPDHWHINSEQLTKFCKEVASGLAYLHMLKLVHRDLALRNCLVTEKGDRIIVAKVADFGFARGLGDKNYYRFERKASLPIRWMPPESLQFGYYNFETDIWSFGIVLYELATFGALPYPELSLSQVIDHVKRTEKPLRMPEDATAELKHIVSLCHEYQAKDRPTAEFLIKYFEENSACVTACLEESPPVPELPEHRVAPSARTPGGDDRGRHRSGEKFGPFSSMSESNPRLNQASINSANRGYGGMRWQTGRSSQGNLHSVQFNSDEHIHTGHHVHHHSGGHGYTSADTWRDDRNEISSVSAPPLDTINNGQVPLIEMRTHSNGLNPSRRSSLPDSDEQERLLTRV